MIKDIFKTMNQGMSKSITDSDISGRQMDKFISELSSISYNAQLLTEINKVLELL